MLIVRTRTAPPRMTVQITLIHNKNNGTIAKAPYIKVKDVLATTQVKSPFSTSNTKAVTNPPSNPCAIGTLQLGTVTNNSVKATVVNKKGPTSNTNARIPSAS